MTDLKIIFLCARFNIMKWTATPRVASLAVIIAAFLAYHSMGLVQFAAAEGIPVTAWIFPHLLTPVMLLVYGSLTLLLFCDAPFSDNHMPFLIIRTGRLRWVSGQLIYIVLAAFIYTCFFVAVSILVLIPQVQFTLDWGVIIKTLAVNTSAAARHGIKVTVFFNDAIIRQFSAVDAMLISFGLFWLVSVFMGVLIFSFNIVVGKTSGLVAAGIFICISYFSFIQGRLALGEWVSYLSPLNWSCMHYLNWSGTVGSELSGTLIQPTPAYAILCLTGSILLMILVSSAVFCRKDLNIQEGGQ